MRLRVLVLGLVALVVAGGGTTAVASTSGVVISQVYGGGGNSGATYTHDFIELYNAGSSTISLDGWSVQYASTTGSSWQVTALSGSIAPGGYYLVRQQPGAGGTTPLPPFDASGTIAMSATAGKVALVTSATVVSGSCPTGGTVHDFVGYGSGTNCFEGSAPTATLSNTTAALRKNNGALDTDDNANDFAVGAPNPRNSGFGQELAPRVSSTTPADAATNVARDANVSITFSEPVDVADGWYSIVCGTSGAHTASVGGGPTTFVLDPTSSFAGDETCTVTVVAAKVTDQDTTDPPDAMAANHVFTFRTIASSVCGDPATKIPAIQGSGPNAAITGNVSVEGVVVGDFEGTSALGGFYLQDPAGDDDPATSDGIFVLTGGANVVSAGQAVRVSGFARERFNQTAITGPNSNDPVTNVLVCGTGSVAPTDVTMPFAAMDAPERYEGMLVRFPQGLVIAEYFNYDRFGELVLALPLDGETRPFTPTSIVEPGAPAQARAQANLLRRITLDDGLGVQNPAFLRHPNGGAFTLDNRFRGGDTVANAVGVLGFDFSLYRIHPTAPAGYSAANPRPAAPAAVGGRVSVAAFNTLNYFLTLDYPTGDPNDNTCGPLRNVECRGADSDQPDEFTRQRAKLLAALVGLNADVVGLNELENTAGVDPLGDPERGLVAGLNGILGPGTYARIDTGPIGGDAIRVGMIYKPSKVKPVGTFTILTSAVDPRFIERRSRPALAQTFEELATGARFTVVANHLKSKGSACTTADGHFDDPDLGDGQGNCNVTRTRAAEALVDWLAADPTGSGDRDFLIAGDLNAYAMEDPIDAIKAGPDDTAGTADDYTNLVSAFLGPYAYSYVFDGQSGYLDHALANATLAPQVTGVAEWHINADEPDVLDYDTSFKPPAQDALYEPNAYRSSDHDPVLVGLAPVPTYDDLRRLVRSFVANAGLANALIAKLDGAEAAAARGNDAAEAGGLEAFVNEVKAQIGKALTAEQAEILIRAASLL